MADVKDEIEIAIDESKKPELNEEVVVESAESNEQVEEKSAPSVEDGVEALKAQLAQERRRAQEAERREREALQNANRAQTDVHETNIRLVDNAIATKKQESASLKQQYRDALMNGDYDTAAEAQEKMATTAAQILQLENGRQALENGPQIREMPRQNDPVRAFAEDIRSSGYPRSAEWIERNPQFVTDPRLNQKMVAAHNLAIADGYRADSDEYFAAIEETLRIKSPVPARKERTESVEEDASAGAAQVVSRRSGSSPPAAPVSRQPVSNSGDRPSVVRLTAEQREIAAMNGMTEKEYAQNLLALKKEGRLN